MGSSAAEIMDSSPETLTSWPSAWLEGGGGETVGCGECPCWAKMEEVTDQALHLRDLCRGTSQALPKSDLVCETQKLLTDFFPLAINQ